MPLILRQAEYATMAEAAAGRRDLTYLRGFLHGYGSAVAERITERRTDLVRETPGADLVLASRAHQVEDAFSRLLGAYLSTNQVTERVAVAGIAAGHAAGRRADLGDTRINPTSPRAVSH